MAWTLEVFYTRQRNNWDCFRPTSLQRKHRRRNEIIWGNSCFSAGLTVSKTYPCHKMPNTIHPALTDKRLAPAPFCPEWKYLPRKKLWKSRSRGLGEREHSLRHDSVRHLPGLLLGNGGLRPAKASIPSAEQVAVQPQCSAQPSPCMSTAYPHPLTKLFSSFGPPDLQMPLTKDPCHRTPCSCLSPPPQPPRDSGRRPCPQRHRFFLLCSQRHKAIIS